MKLRLSIAYDAAWSTFAVCLDDKGSDQQCLIPARTHYLLV
jgi:hypothetical protein